MRRMGGSCSLQRRRAFGQRNKEGYYNKMNEGNDVQRKVRRHSVDSEVPDGSISALYPVADNYIIVENGLRSPKTLIELCIDTVCRSLPDLEGELPPGLPQDLVDSILRSLVKHSALNATTLKTLRRCELGELPLAGCRGVSDEWLFPLSKRNFTFSAITPDSSQKKCSSTSLDFEQMEIDSSTSLIQQRNNDYESKTGSVDNHIPTVVNNENNLRRRQQKHSGCLPCSLTCNLGDDSSSCSTSSFHSATSTPHLAPTTTNSSSIINSCDTHSSASRQPTSSEEIMETQSIDQSQTQSSSFLHSSCMYELEPSITSQMTLLDLRGSQRLTDRGLLQLSDLASLEIARLDHCHSLVGRGLIAFSNSSQLHTLSLSNCRCLTDEAIINISHLSSISNLSLDGCRCLTDAALASIGHLYQLRKLEMSQLDLITDDGLQHLVNLDRIDELSLGWCRSITDRGLDVLTAQPLRNENLRVFSIARCRITDKGIGYLARLSALEELDMNGCSSVGSTALGSTLEKLKNLTSLDVSYCTGILRSSWQGKINSLKTLELCYTGVRDSHLSRLTDLHALEEINFDSCPVGDWSIAHLADNNVMPNLVSLDMADTDLTDLGMVHLPKFKNLTRLSLFYCNISNAGLRHLSSMTSLEVLNLDSRDIGDDGLHFLRQLTNLKSLDIFSGRITDNGCAHLSTIKSLENLELCGGGVADLGCAHLATLGNLTSLNLSQNERITNRGAASLAALSKLKALNLSNTRVNVNGLRYLSGLVHLQSLALYGCGGIQEEEKLKNLQKDLPSLKCLRLNCSLDDNDGVVRNESNFCEEAHEEDDEGLMAEINAGDNDLRSERQDGSESSDSLASSHNDGDDDDFDEDEVDITSHEENDDSILSEIDDNEEDNEGDFHIDEMDLTS